MSLQLATYSKFQPQSVDFLDISNPKAVYHTHTHTHTHSLSLSFLNIITSLELKLRLFACLTKGDVIQINYNDKVIQITKLYCITTIIIRTLICWY